MLTLNEISLLQIEARSTTPQTASQDQTLKTLVLLAEVAKQLILVRELLELQQSERIASR